MSIWKFLGIEPSKVLPLDRVAEHSVVDAPGIYVLIAESHEYTYPKGTSPIFYIGMATKLAARLTTHRRRTRGAADSTAAGLEWRRYEYGAAHGCIVAAFPADGSVESGLRSIESDAISLFAAFYGAPPIANGAASLKNVLRRQSAAPPLGLTNRSWAHPKELRSKRSGTHTRGLRADIAGSSVPALVDRILSMARRFDPDLQLTRKVKYFGFSKANTAFNFAKCREQKDGIRLDVVLRFSADRMAKLRRTGLADLDYKKHIGAYVFLLNDEDLTKHEALVSGLLREAYDVRGRTGKRAQ